MNQVKFIVTFAGPVGSSKTPIAHYLSYNFNLPIYNNDATRTEVTEDFLSFNEEEFKIRRDSRIREILKKGNSFILDASMDREWKNYIDEINKSGYRVFIISMDLSKDYLHKLYEVKGYKDSLKRIDVVIEDHKKFLKEFGEYINVHITDRDFNKRLELSANRFKIWLKSLEL